MSLRMSGVHKSAVRLLSLGSEPAQDILRRLPPDIAEQVAGEFVALRNLPPAVRVEVLTEFCDAANETHMLAAPSSAATAPAPTAPFAALHHANPDNLVDCLRDEHPQAIALILTHLPAARCAEVLSALPSQQQFEVVKRLAHIEQA